MSTICFHIRVGDLSKFYSTSSRMFNLVYFRYFTITTYTNTYVLKKFIVSSYS